jgi:hypothetical protein
LYGRAGCLNTKNAGFRPGQKTPEEFAAALSAPGHGGFEVIFSFAELDWPYKAMAQHKRELQGETDRVFRGLT